MTARDSIQPLRAAVRPLLIDSGIPDVPLGIWGTCFLAAHRGHLFVVTARHLTENTHSGEIRILLSDRSFKRLPLSRGIGVFADRTAEEVDLVIFPATLVGLSRKEMAQARTVDLNPVNHWNLKAFVSEFVVIGYPSLKSSVDYDAGIVNAGQVLIRGTYGGHAPGTKFTHALQVNNELELSDFGGFSGSPVFALEQRLGSEPRIRFCGVAVAGSAAYSKMHFIDAETVRGLMTVALQHVDRHGLELTEKVKKPIRI